MRRFVLCLLACAGLGGCSAQHTPGGTPDDADPANSAADSGAQPAPQDLRFASSGQRLEARYYVADGAEQFQTLHDSELGFDCDFAPDAVGDGMHCVPSQTFEVFYLDSDCKEPATAVQDNDASYTGPPTDDWISAHASEPSSTCVNAPPAPRVTYRFGEQVLAGGHGAIGMMYPAVHAMRDSACEASTIPQTGLLQPAVYRLQPQDANLLVAGKASTLALEGGLSVRRVVADDAAQITIAVLGRDDAPCSLLQDGRCVPPPVASVGGSSEAGFFLDAECKTAAFNWAFTRCPERPLGQREVDGVVHIYELSPVHDLFVKQMGSCEPFQDESSVYAAGDDVTAMFPQASKQLTGVGKLHLDRFVATGTQATNGGGVVQLDRGATFADDAGHACEVLNAVDGSLRCLSDRSQQFHESSYSKDARCTRWLYSPVDSTADVSELRYVEFGGDHQPWKLSALFSLEAPSAIYVGDTSGGCALVQAPPDVVLLTQGQELPLDSLPALESVDL